MSDLVHNNTRTGGEGRFVIRDADGTLHGFVVATVIEEEPKRAYEIKQIKRRSERLVAADAGTLSSEDAAREWVRGPARVAPEEHLEGRRLLASAFRKRHGAPEQMLDRSGLGSRAQKIAKREGAKKQARGRARGRG